MFHASIRKTLTLTAVVCSLAMTLTACSGGKGNNGGVGGNFPSPFPIPTPPPFPRPSPSPSQRDWIREAAARSSQNPASPRHAAYNMAMTSGTNWGAGETIMSPAVTARFIRSIDALDAKFPDAVPNAQSRFREISQAVRNFHPENHVEKQLIHAAAMRFLNRVAHDPFYRDGSMVFLSIKEVMALTWAAMKDRSVYSQHEFDTVKLWQLIVQLGRIQRAHNDNRPQLWKVTAAGTWDLLISGDDSTRGVVDNNTGAINWDPNHRPGHYYQNDDDSSSCVMGAFKRMLEHLAGNYPDVTLFADVPEVSQADLAFVVPDHHNTLWGLLTAAQRGAIENGILAGATVADRNAYLQYRQDLRRRLQVEVLGATWAVIDRIITHSTMGDLLHGDGDEADPALRNLDPPRH